MWRLLALIGRVRSLRQLSVEPWSPGTSAGSLVDGIGVPGDPGAGTHTLVGKARS